MRKKNCIRSVDNQTPACAIKNAVVGSQRHCQHAGGEKGQNTNSAKISKNYSCREESCLNINLFVKLVVPFIFTLTHRVKIGLLGKCNKLHLRCHVQQRMVP